ncbi:oxygen-dependent coproporphyrinogen oxidase [Lyticum sinuosum]|uniref:coproporphyrinogen oxidase n=1 Tax=Lyticum sinuosum TaxID=1332059 RepID=A0AAE4VKR3_9RICK|nr:oxygen-dependent coproporphyrinogen oxidase [Lyticum sinuosum]MDZ5761069.1 Coproporphyrinogen-III oxidase [Lyticum sinuosum]
MKIFHGLFQNNFSVYSQIEERKVLAERWFRDLRDIICRNFVNLERDLHSSAEFERKIWQRNGGGGGEISLLTNGRVFEKVGVNISTVYGTFSQEFAEEIPGTSNDNREFWASGISLVAHPLSPHIPTAHMNTRMIVTQKSWFGGGADITPCLSNIQLVEDFHNAMKKTCDKYNRRYYNCFKKECDEYFFIRHRNEPRGAGGIFYDYLNTNKWNHDFGFNRAVGESFLSIYSSIIKQNMTFGWTEGEKEIQLQKRGRYVEFNLLYDRGTRFGLMTGGNIDAILMSLPPIATWPGK